MKKIFFNKLWIFFTIWLAPLSYLNAQDHVLDWVKSFRAAFPSQSFGNIIKLDANKNIFVAGNFVGSPDFDPGPSVYSLTSIGQVDIFVCKLDSSGNFIWAKRTGGTTADDARSMDIDTFGNVYISGGFQGTSDFDPSSGSYNITSSGTYDGFVWKLGSAGDFKWALKIGGSQNDFISSINVDNFNKLICVGHFGSTVDFDPGSGTYTMTTYGNVDAFVCKLDLNSNFILAKQFGGTLFDSGYLASTDILGNIIVAGTFGGTADFNPGSGTYNMTSNGSSDMFYAKLDSVGNFIWAKHIGGIASENPNSIAIGKNGEIYTTGVFRDTVDFDPGIGSYKLYANGIPNEASFTSKLDSAGNFLWAIQQCGVGSGSGGSGIYLDSSENVYTTGFFLGLADFDPGIDTFYLQCSINTSGHSDVYISKLSSNGNFVWAKIITGKKLDVGLSICGDANGNIYTSGYYSDTTDFDPRNGVYKLITTSFYESFIHKMKPCTIRSSSINLTVCNNYKSPSLKYNWTTTGTYNDTIANYVGCDSIITFNLIIKKKSSSLLNISTCKSYISPSNKYTWTASGIYRDTIPNYVGCDSIISITLIIKSNTGSTNITACNTYKSPSGRYTWNLTGIYKDTLINILGCDSVITINLLIDTSTQSYITPSACMIYKSPSNKYTWTTSGIYTDTLKNYKNCDSIITINLTIKNVTYSTINLSKCGSYKSPSNKYMWTVSGVYKDTITNMVGCDSIITINLVINSITSSFLNIMTCSTYQSPSKKYNWSTSGIYKDTILNALGCDSNITINLSVNINSSSVVSITACDKYIFHSQLYTSSGTYIQTINNAKGCDSIVTLNISIKKSSTNSYSINSCRPITSPSGKYIWSSSGIYKDTIPNKIGCDSILTVNFTFNGFNTVVTKSGARLTAALSGAVYQWHICLPNSTFTPIPGEIFQSFIASVAGNYAVKISYNSCIDTSACITVNNIGMNSVIKSNTINIFPNPAGQKITVELIQFREETNFKIRNTIGQTLIEGPLKQTLTEVNLSSLSPGIYFIEIKEGDSISRIKILKN